MSNNSPNDKVLLASRTSNSGKKTQSSLTADVPIKRTATFPLTPSLSNVLGSAVLEQKGYEHQKLTLTYIGSLTVSQASKKKATVLNRKTPVKVGDPVKFDWSVGKNKSSFVGYVYSVKNIHSTHKNHTVVTCLGSSGILQKHKKRVFKNVAASDVFYSIGKENKFNIFYNKTKAKYKMLSQAGLTDWQMLRQLAAKTGHALWCDLTTLFFVDQDIWLAKKMTSIRQFSFANANPIGIIVKQNIYSFESSSIAQHSLNGGDLEVSVDGNSSDTLALDYEKPSLNFGSVDFLTSSDSISNGVSGSANYLTDVTTFSTVSPVVSIDYGDTYGAVPVTTVDNLVDETQPNIVGGS